MSLEFATADIPATITSRPTEPNPFDGHFPSDDKALVVTLPGTVLDDAHKAKINKVKAQARKAAQNVDRTARIKEEVKEHGTGKTKVVETTLTIWTVARITRPRKSNGNTPSE